MSPNPSTPQNGEDMTSSFEFLSLPAEIRLMIYRLLFEFQDGTYFEIDCIYGLYPGGIEPITVTQPAPPPYYRIRDMPRLAVQLLRVNTICYQEAAPVLYGEDSFAMRNFRLTNYSVFSRIRLNNAAMLRCLTLDDFGKMNGKDCLESFELTMSKYPGLESLSMENLGPSPKYPDWTLRPLRLVRKGLTQVLSLTKVYMKLNPGFFDGDIRFTTAKGRPEEGVSGSAGLRYLDVVWLTHNRSSPWTLKPSGRRTGQRSQQRGK